MKPSKWNPKILNVLAALIASVAAMACTRCPESEFGDLTKKVAPPETKNDGADLKGWTYEHVVSKTSNETHYFYRYAAEASDKPTFVFVHGLLFDGKNFLNMKPLATDFNLIAYDLPNASSFYRGGTDDFAALLGDFLQTLQLKEIYLGGVSLGGQISMIYASKPRAVPVKGLLLISTDIAKNEKELSTARKIAKTTGRVTDRDEKKTLCVVTKLVNKKKKDAKGKLNTLDHVVLRGIGFYNQVLDTSIDMESPVPLESIHVPTLIIHGDNDSVVPIDKARGLADVIPNAKFVVLHGGEHTIAYARANKIVKLVKEKFVEAPPVETAAVN